MAESFEVELEALVRRVSRELAEEVTALILRRLGIEEASARRAQRGAQPPRPSRPRAAPAQKPAHPKRHRASSDERARSLERVERVLVQSPGLALGEIERASGLPRATVTAALKALKDDRRVFMGGTRRYARYATSQAAADNASEEARAKGG